MVRKKQSRLQFFSLRRLWVTQLGWLIFGATPQNNLLWWLELSAFLILEQRLRQVELDFVPSLFMPRANSHRIAVSALAWLSLV